MSNNKEYEALNAFIEQQQARINELMQVVLMLETRNRILEEENERLLDINSRELDKDGNVIVRQGLKERIIRNLQSTNAERRSVELQSGKTTIRGFSHKRAVNRGSEDVIND
jgi:hypothetical protein